MSDKIKPKSENVKTSAKGIEEEDYYFENGLMVMSEAYHLKRGYCCKSSCRHCPYGFKAPESSETCES